MKGNMYMEGLLAIISQSNVIYTSDCKRKRVCIDNMPNGNIGLGNILVYFDIV